MSVDDGKLVSGVLNGDRSAFAELYDRRARLIRAICYDECRSHQTAADLTQEAFLRAYQKLGQLRDPDRFAAWLVGISRQVCREWRRSRRRERHGLAEFAERKRQSEAWSEPHERMAEVTEQIASLTAHEHESLPSLTDKERLALHAYYLQELNVDEARSVLGLSRSGFYRVLSSACERLRRALNRREVHP